MNRKKELIITLIAIVAVIILFSFFLKDIMIPFIKAEMKNNVNEAKEILKDNGWFGFAAVVLIEAIQMVVIFIPAEFIQISCGLSFPFPIALILCDLGVCLGSLIIFSLVRLFKFSSSAYIKNKEKIDLLGAKTNNDKQTILFMLLLFIMPLIPFGAICYFGSGTKLPLKKYLPTVAVGCLPSIVTSNLMGTAGRAFIKKTIPLWILILIIAVLGLLLFITLLFFIFRYFLKENDRTPESVLFSSFMRFVERMRKNKQKLIIEDKLMQKIEDPYIILANHESFYDFYYVSKIVKNKPAAIVGNEYYLSLPIIRHLSLKKGYPVMIFPEGRLSTDGTNYPIVEKSGAFYKKLNRDIVFVKLEGAYLSKPKWRKSFLKSEIRVTVSKIIKKDELAEIDASELDRIIQNELSFNDFDNHINCYKSRNLAKGLEKILYICPSCGELYRTKGEGNVFKCHSCGKELHILPDYSFEGDNTIKNIADYYREIKNIEKTGLDSLHIETAVKTKIFNPKGRTKKETGICELSAKEFVYKSKNEEFHVPTDEILAMPYSCGEEFELYLGNRLHYFYPTHNRNQVVRWALIIDLLYERRSGLFNNEQSE